jgi:hypothetical protein
MTRILAGIAALGIMGAAALPFPASAAEQKSGISNESAQLTEVSSQRRYYGHRYYGRRYLGPRYYARPYWGPRYYGGYGYPYYGYRGYYRPGLAFGIGPFGFGVF